ncbi:stage II sporulation protein M [Candidatus Woesearchaeota archaeon]|nr:stage II sporulation protein M [Candidatus Woesearchaeota archaeon]
MRRARRVGRAGIALEGTMVLEKIYPLELIEKSPLYALVLGAAYATIGIGAAVLLFPDDPAIVAVAFIALIVYPTLSKLLKEEEEKEARNEEFAPITFIKDHENSFQVYTLLFLGMLLSFSFFAIMLPSLATNHIFENQIDVLYGAGKSGQAVFSKGLFTSILLNNASVLVLAFISAFIFGDGGIFLLTWNASVWGTIFGNLAKTAALSSAKSPLIYFALVFFSVFPHMILEAFSYVCSATAGGVISKGMLKERLFSPEFNRILRNTAVFMAFAFIILLVAVSVETYVLGNAATYRLIIQQSFAAR